jgi:hypothetical protein
VEEYFVNLVDLPVDGVPDIGVDFVNDLVGDPFLSIFHIRHAVDVESDELRVDFIGLQPFTLLLHLHLLLPG